MPSKSPNGAKLRKANDKVKGKDKGRDKGKRSKAIPVEVTPVTKTILKTPSRSGTPPVKPKKLTFAPKETVHIITPESKKHTEKKEVAKEQSMSDDQASKILATMTTATTSSVASDSETSATSACEDDSISGSSDTGEGEEDGKSSLGSDEEDEKEDGEEAAECDESDKEDTEEEVEAESEKESSSEQGAEEEEQSSSSEDSSDIEEKKAAGNKNEKNLQANEKPTKGKNGTEVPCLQHTTMSIRFFIPLCPSYSVQCQHHHRTVSIPLYVLYVFRMFPKPVPRRRRWQLRPANSKSAGDQRRVQR